MAFLHKNDFYNSSKFSPIVSLFHLPVPKSEPIYSVLAPKNCKSAHNLAHPSGKGLQTADNWLELELNGVLFATKNSLLSDNVVKCGSGGGAMRKMMTWEIWKCRLGEILFNFSKMTRCTTR